MGDTVRGILGVGVTLLVFGLTMATVNGIVRGAAAKRLANDPDDEWAMGLLILF